MSVNQLACLSVPNGTLGAQSGADILGLMAYLLLFVVILGFAYWTTRFVGQAYQRSNPGSHIQVVDRRLVAQDKSVTVIKVNERFYVLYSDRNGCVVLDQLDSYPEAPKETQTFTFNTVLKRAMGAKNESEK